MLSSFLDRGVCARIVSVVAPAAALLVSAPGCDRKLPPPPVEDTTPATAAPPVALPPFTAPSSMPPGETYFVTDHKGVIRIDARGSIKHDAQSIAAITRSVDGKLYGTTWDRLFRRDPKKGWTRVVDYGEKVKAALVTQKQIQLSVGPGAQPVVTLLASQLWSGKVEKTMAMFGATLNLSPVALDGKGIAWGAGLDDDSLYSVDGIGDPKATRWGSKPIEALLGRSSGGVYLLTTDKLLIGSQADAVEKSITLPPLGKDPKLAAGPNGTVAIRSSDGTLVLVSPDGGSTTLKQPTGEVFAVDGRSRVWSVIQGEVHVVSADGTAVVQKIPADMGADKIIAIFPWDGGGEVK